jgi:hypothetical protein
MEPSSRAKIAFIKIFKILGMTARGIKREAVLPRRNFAARRAKF